MRIQIEHSERADETVDRGCRDRDKLHHFQLVDDATVRAPYYESFEWRCSHCSTGLIVRLRAPEFGDGLLQDLYAVRPQASWAAAQTQAADKPSRFSTLMGIEYLLRHTAEFKPTDALDKPRRIGLASADGQPSMFVRRVGREPAVAKLMKACHFRLAPADWDGESYYEEGDVYEEFDAAAAGEQIEWEWVPPDPRQLGMRDKLRRMRLEMQILAKLAKVPSDPHRERAWKVRAEPAEAPMYPLADAPLKLFTAAASWQVDEESAQEKAYATLGIQSNFTDNVALEFFTHQTEQDPLHRSHYLTALDEVARARRGDNLQFEVQRQRSMGNYTRQDLVDAYKTLNECEDEDDETVINIAESLMLDIEKDEIKLRIRHAVEIVGSERQSSVIRKYLATPQQDFADIDAALAYLGAEADTEDEFLMILYDDKHETNERLAKAAMMTIADARENARLKRFVETGERDVMPSVAFTLPEDGNGPTVDDIEMLDPDIAYSRLGVDDRNIDDDMLITLYEIRSMDEPDDALKLRRALEVVGDFRSSKAIRGYLNTGEKEAPAPYRPPEGRADVPVGLENIGNTCYLNSLLQYYFSIRPLRELILDSTRWQAPAAGRAETRKKVGGRLVSNEEIDRAHHFMRELRELFQQLVNCPQGSYRPSRAVCFLALVSHRQAAQQAPTKLEAVLDKQAGSALPSTSENQVVLFSEDKENDPAADIDMSDYARSPKRKLSEGNELVMPEPASSLIDGEEAVPSLANPDSRRGSLAAEEPVKKVKRDDIWIDRAVSPMSTDAQPDTDGDEVLGELSANATLEPPPQPPRPSVRRHSSVLWSEANDFGQQQDLTECIDNCLFQMEAALDAENTDANGEQLDLIKHLFYGKTRQVLEVEGNEPREDWFSNTIVNLERDGQDLYAALDGVFAVNKVELAGRQVSMATTASKLPAILQVQIQRATFDLASMSAKKDNTYLKLDDVVYLDRYLTCPPGSDMAEERNAYHAVKRNLAALEERRKELVNAIDAKEMASAPMPSPVPSSVLAAADSSSRPASSGSLMPPSTSTTAAQRPTASTGNGSGTGSGNKRDELYRDHSWTCSAQEVSSDDDEDVTEEYLALRRGSVREVLPPGAGYAAQQPPTTTAIDEVTDEDEHEHEHGPSTEHHETVDPPAIPSLQIDEVPLIDFDDSEPAADIVMDTVDDEEGNDAGPSKEELEQSLADVDSETAKLTAALGDSFADYKQHGYRLHAVFMHRGEASHGHYWIYIRDFDTPAAASEAGADADALAGAGAGAGLAEAQGGRWRKYNDEEVTDITEAEVFAELKGKNENPYMLTYVAAGRERELTNALCRSLPPTSAAASASASAVVAGGAAEGMNDSNLRPLGDDDSSDLPSSTAGTDGSKTIVGDSDPSSTVHVTEQVPIDPEIMDVTVDDNDVDLLA